MGASAKAVRFGIVGLGVGAGRAKRAAETEGAELVVVCSLLEDRAKTLAEELGCEWTTELEEVLARDDLDAIGVFTPSGRHCEHAVQVMNAGKHAFTTKPMDIRTEKCDEAIKVSKETGKVLGVDFDSRYNPVHHQIREALQGGALGKVYQFDLLMKWHRGQDYYDGGSPPGWRSRKETEGGSMANQGVHYVDLVQWWGGPVKSVVGDIATVAHKIETEDLSNSLWEFKSGARATVVTTTASTPGMGTLIEVNGDKGVMVWRDGKVERWETETGARLEDFEAPEGLPPHIIGDMVSAITKGTAPVVGGAEGRKSVAIFEAVYRSAAEGKEVGV